MIPSDSGPRELHISVSACLSADRILPHFPAMEKEALMETLVRRLCADQSLPGADSIWRKIRVREQGISTTLDSGLSLPHARVEGLREVAAILALPACTVRDLQHPEIPIRAMLLFFSPGDPGQSQRHLQFLRSIAKLFNPEFIDRLSVSASPGQALAMIREKEEVL